MKKRSDINHAKLLSEYVVKGMIPEVNVKSEENQILNVLIAHRNILKQTSIKLKNQIYEIMFRYGIETKRKQLNSKTGRMKILKILENELNSKQKNNKIYDIVKNIIEDINKIDDEIEEVEDNLKALAAYN